MYDRVINETGITSSFFLLSEKEVSRFHWFSSTQIRLLLLLDVAFESDTEKVLDHCHSTVKFFGYAHNECNLKRRTIFYTPIFAHNMMNNMMNYLHHIVKSIHTASRTTKFDVTATNDEKFIALNFGIFMENRKRKRGEVIVHENLRFIDSFKFMPCSLEKLVETLPENKFSLLDSFFRGYTEDQRALLKKKGNFQYSYVDSFIKLNDATLHSLEKWKKGLRENKVEITQHDLDQLKKKFSEFNCANLKGFLELYLTEDVLQLACWFEELRSVCYNTYGLDCAQFYTASNPSGSACLKVCNPELEPLTDRNILDMTERMIRGGLASVFSSRLELANNPQLTHLNIE